MRDDLFFKIMIVVTGKTTHRMHLIHHDIKLDIVINQKHSLPIWVLSQENLILLNMKNKVADQLVHLHSLLSVFVIQLLESMIQ